MRVGSAFEPEGGGTGERDDRGAAVLLEISHSLSGNRHTAVQESETRHGLEVGKDTSADRQCSNWNIDIGELPRARGTNCPDIIILITVSFKSTIQPFRCLLFVFTPNDTITGQFEFAYVSLHSRSKPRRHPSYISTSVSGPFLQPSPLQTFRNFSGKA